MWGWCLNETVSIRLAGPEDAEAVVGVYVESWNRGFGSRMPAISADPARIERWRIDLGEQTPTLWWLAELSGQVVGFVGIGPSRDPADGQLGELDTIAVRSEHWGGGIGSRLMSVALTGMRAQGYQQAILWTLRDYPLGETFYRSHGWVRNGWIRTDGDQVCYQMDL